MPLRIRQQRQLHRYPRDREEIEKQDQARAVPGARAFYRERALCASERVRMCAGQRDEGTRPLHCTCARHAMGASELTSLDIANRAKPVGVYKSTLSKNKQHTHRKPDQRKLQLDETY